MATTINELRAKRAQAWEGAKAFLESHRNEKGILSAEDDAAYTRMEQDIDALGKEIKRLERQQEIDAELNRPTSQPIKEKPAATTGIADTKQGRKSDEYKVAFWNMIRSKAVTPEVLNVLQIGTDADGGYLAPDEFEHTLISALEEENIFRKFARTLQTNSGDRLIPVVSSHGKAEWMDENALVPESDDKFAQMSVSAYKLGTFIKVSDELLNDAAFDIPNYIATEFARRMGAREEEAFFVGDGVKKPTGIFADEGGADVGVTLGSAAITADSLIDLFYSLRAPYRRNAVWIMNDSTVKAIRKLKDKNDQYLWQTALTAGTPDTILNRPIYTSPYVPEIANGNKVMMFGDLKYYWVVDRQGRSFKRLNELFATTGQVGFMTTQRVDGKLTLSEAIKVMQVKGTNSGNSNKG
ncbi:phage major capsid protein [Selenomonas sp. AB3002]|uniref:phage major capsid protein n=1 Tax=Selenomonas sp. AB3002 TaxID=1392502 RepID=UPI000495E808